MSPDVSLDTGVVVRKRVYLDDLDGFGMLHHARYAILFDEAVLDYWLEAGWNLDPSKSVSVIRSLELSYHTPVLGMQDVDVHFWIDRVGTTSVGYRFRVLSADHDTLHARGSRGLVILDPVTLRPCAVSDEMWKLAEPLFGPGVAARGHQQQAPEEEE